jgi:D-lactate dehydrogenase (cytochrome)
MTRPSPDAAAFTALQAKLLALLGPKGVISEPAELAPYLLESRGLHRGSTPFMALPASVEEVAETLRLAAEAGIAVVPQGGNTGRVSGALVLPEHGAILVNLKRLKQIRAVDPIDNAMTVEAGCILAEVQAAAAQADRLFPLSLGAEGSCQIGGNLASNAGGIHVLRYGNIRDLVLGLEVVLPNGEIWDGLSTLRKDNTGYDLKQLFIGAEGTLGIITAATLKLFPRPRESVSLFIALADLEAGLELLSAAQDATGGGLCACELIPGIALDFTLRHIPGSIDPLEKRYDWHLLMEATSGQAGSGLREALESVLEEAFTRGRVPDAAIAASEAQAKAFWHLREALVEAQIREGASIKHDISVPVSKVPSFLRQAAEAVEALQPGIRPYPFGHLGDGNIHYNLSQPPGMAPEAFLARAPEIQSKVHDIAVALGGSISAEHGIGLVKLAENARFKSAVEQDLMRRVKDAIDPAGLMNPGKLVSKL